MTMKPPDPGTDKFIERRREIHHVGQLRREKMIVMRLGERRVSGKYQPDPFGPATKK